MLKTYLKTKAALYEWYLIRSPAIVIGGFCTALARLA